MYNYMSANKLARLCVSNITFVISWVLISGYCICQLRQMCLVLYHLYMVQCRERDTTGRCWVFIHQRLPLLFLTLIWEIETFSTERNVSQSGFYPADGMSTGNLMAESSHEGISGRPPAWVEMVGSNVQVRRRARLNQAGRLFEKVEGTDVKWDPRRRLMRMQHLAWTAKYEVLQYK